MELERQQVAGLFLSPTALTGAAAFGPITAIREGATVKANTISCKEWVILIFDGFFASHSP
jgi:hypothetical protein